MSSNNLSTPGLDLGTDVVALTAVLCDLESVSRDENRIADAVETALRPLRHLQVTRDGNAVIARTNLRRRERVVLAGHLDTVPLTDPPNLPTRRVGDNLVGRGTCDMKGGVAIQLRLAALLSKPNRDVTYVFYDCEEIEDEHNGLARVARNNPDLLRADFAVLLEPTDGVIEGGCNGTLRVNVTVKGKAAHSARPWNGINAIHESVTILGRLVAYEPQTVAVDGLDYREALSAVGIRGGIAGNVIPDECVVTVNYRFAPDKSGAQALTHVRELFDGYAVELTDTADGARPGLDLPSARAFVEALAVPVNAKQGWTDVARFSELSIPAVNFGPGDPNWAHHDQERCPVQQLVDAEAALLRWLDAAPV
ncbi:MAG TPA: succinyl-diaminopimelate desuccinylase [Dermatophilaceae bacterium]